MRAVTYLVVFVSVECDECRGPEGVHAESAQYHVGVVCFMVVTDPASNKSPEGLDAWIGTPSSCLFWLATYFQQITALVSSSGCPEALCMFGHLPSLGYCHKFLGASLAVNGVYDFSYKFEIM